MHHFWPPVPGDHRCSVSLRTSCRACSRMGGCFQSSAQLPCQQSPLRWLSQERRNMECQNVEFPKQVGIREVYRKPLAKASTSCSQNSNFMRAQRGTCWVKFETLGQFGEHSWYFAHKFVVAKDLLFPMFQFDFNWLEDVKNLFHVNGLQNFCNIIANQSPLVIHLTFQTQFSQGVIKSCLERPPSFMCASLSWAALNCCCCCLPFSCCLSLVLLTSLAFSLVFTASTVWSVNLLSWNKYIFSP